MSSKEEPNQRLLEMQLCLFLGEMRQREREKDENLWDDAGVCALFKTSLLLHQCVIFLPPDRVVIFLFFSRSSRLLDPRCSDFPPIFRLHHLEIIFYICVMTFRMHPNISSSNFIILQFRRNFEPMVCSLGWTRVVSADIRCVYCRLGERRYVTVHVSVSMQFDWSVGWYTLMFRLSRLNSPSHNLSRVFGAELATRPLVVLWTLAKSALGDKAQTKNKSQL